MDPHGEERGKAARLEPCGRALVPQQFVDAGRGAGALVALLLGVLASLPLYVLLGRRLHRQKEAARRR